MNKDNAKDYLPLVQALAEGKTIQLLDKDLGGKKWADLESPDFAWHVSFYRIKPEPKKAWYRVALVRNSDGQLFTSTADSTEANKDPENMLIYEWGTAFIEWLTDRIEYELPEGEV
ncbi:hypothetical protein [Undibacterium sp.]|uniref:hypothetical protein n=1 Tax=Undibacterium sp. TaxID=1914977 RepID=UPI0037525FAB